MSSSISGWREELGAAGKNLHFIAQKAGGAVQQQRCVWRLASAHWRHLKQTAQYENKETKKQ